MNNQSISISLTNEGSITNPYWLHMEVKEDKLDDGMTVAEAASLIDSVYNVKPCLPQDEQRDVWDQSAAAEDVAETEEAQRRFAEALDNEGYAPDAGDTFVDLLTYRVTIKVFRSHRNELYKLQVVNGFAGSAQKKSGRVIHTVDVKGSNSHTFDNPILYRPVIIWQGIDGPEIHIKGNTVHWEGEVEGTLRAEYDTEWDEVAITITGDYRDRSMITGTYTAFLGTGWYSGTEDGSELNDYQNLECSVLAFYHYQLEELVLNRPEEDSSGQNDISRFINENAEDDSEENQQRSCLDKCIGECDKVDIGGGKDACYESEKTCIDECDGLVGRELEYCLRGCSNSLDECLDTIPQIPDPDCVAKCHDQCDESCQQHVNETIICECNGKEEARDYYEAVPCPQGYSEGSSLPGSKERKTFSDCGYTDEVNTNLYYKEKCCNDWPFTYSMPKCKRVVKRFSGSGDKNFDESDYPKGTIFIPVSPRFGLCGEHTVEQVIHAANCCDGVSQIYWDTENSVEIVSRQSSGVVYVTGGQSPYTWSIRGPDFTFSGGVRDAVTTEPYITVYAGAESCGTALLYVTDGCTSVNGDVRSTYGAWNDDCYLAEIRLSAAGLIDRYRPGVYHPEYCAVCYGELVMSPPPSGNITVSARTWHYVGGSTPWEAFGCYISFSAMERVSTLAAIAQVTIPVTTLSPNTELLTPTGSINSCASTGKTCKWTC